LDIELLRKTCLNLKGATEDIKWGSDLCFCVGAKMFCVTGVDSPEFFISLKVRNEEFDELIERPGISPAPYVARYKWVLVEGSESLTKDEWQHFISQSYQLVRDKLPKKIKDSLT
jgi:predicted DNA-binding protein (MmcQ/YjbR family)